MYEGQWLPLLYVTYNLIKTVLVTSALCIKLLSSTETESPSGMFVFQGMLNVDPSFLKPIPVFMPQKDHLDKSFNLQVKLQLASSASSRAFVRF